MDSLAQDPKKNPKKKTEQEPRIREPEQSSRSKFRAPFN